MPRGTSAKRYKPAVALLTFLTSHVMIGAVASSRFWPRFEVVFDNLSPRPFSVCNQYVNT